MKRAALYRERPKLEHACSLGGFSGEEYVITLRPGVETPRPWCNILAEEEFGTMVSESGGGYTWAHNSALFKLTPHFNDPVRDLQGERLELCCEGARTSAYGGTVTHGFGFSRFEQGENGILSTLEVFVHGGVKVCLLRVKNPFVESREVAAEYFAAWQMGESPRGSALLYAWTEGGAAFCRQAGARGGVACACAVGEGEGQCGCSLQEYLKRPALLQARESGGADSCAALRLSFVLGGGEEKRLAFLLSFDQTEESAKARVGQLGDLKKIDNAFAAVRRLWKERLGRLRVKTGDPAFDRLMNGRLLYQVWSSRLLARAGYDQPGGAFGFRDQLQDVLALLESCPARVKEQLLLCAAHQFQAGDVMHWWHPPALGVRTAISDDRLFLPFVALWYERVTGDAGVWDVRAPYLKDQPIPPGQKDLYFEAQPAAADGSLFEHCLRAIEKSLTRGAHGLPLMEGGDWNDGMDEVGKNGGESVWLGWFLCAVLCDFSALCLRRGEAETAKRLQEEERRYRIALEQHGWDGGYYRRAYFGDGSPLGTKEAAECRIDAISQAWAVLAGGPHKRAKEAMDALLAELWDRKNGILKLLDPPLDGHLPKTGYLQDYPAGIRENGGQYTHAAAWSILALCRLGKREKAYEVFSTVNPIRHADNDFVLETYKGEPYAVAGDVSGGENAGRAGWTWYTGAAAWLYRAGLELMGFAMQGGEARLSRAAPQLGAVQVWLDGKPVPQAGEAAKEGQSGKGPS